MNIQPVTAVISQMAVPNSKREFKGWHMINYIAQLLVNMVTGCSSSDFRISRFGDWADVNLE